MARELYFEVHGSGEPTLVLLHGLGVNGAAWEPLLPHLADWPGRIVVPDLRGHGRSPHAGNYSYGHHAADVADLLEPDEAIEVLGHSMGGAVGLVLASGLFGVRVGRVTAVGTKVVWQPEEVEKARSRASASVRWFDDRNAAEDRYLLVTGLGEQGRNAPATIAAGLREQAGRYRLAADNAASLVVGPPMRRLFEAAQAPFRLVRGEADAMVSLADLRAFDPHALEIDGAGHHAYLDQPARLARLVHELHLGA